MPDQSGFGLGTAPLGAFNNSRFCRNSQGNAYVPCPYSDDVVIFVYDGEQSTWRYPYGGVKSRIPDTVLQIYSSGTAGMRTTVSNFFDIQWRQPTTLSDRYVDNGTDSVSHTL